MRGTGGELMRQLSDELGAGEPEAMARLRARLVGAAQAEGLIDVAYRTIDSPVGSLLLAATPVGLVQISFARAGHDEAVARLAAEVSPRVLEDARALDEVARELDEYFAGRRRRFDLRLDLRLARGFRRVVIERLADIAYGSTASYAAIAAAAGSPRAVRAVGTACATNPLPLVLPCHRVVRSDGSIGQYGGGVAAKVALIELEANALAGS